MDRPIIAIAPSHPYAGAARGAERELHALVEAETAGNAGRARVCARRAVGAFLQSIASQIESDPGSHSMANLRFLADNPDLPREIREAAARLAVGPRDRPAGTPASSDPLADALLIINYFIRSASS